MLRSFAARVIVVFSFPFVAAHAQTPAAAPAAPAPEAAVANEKPFTLDDAVAQALRKNFDLQVQAYAVENAKDLIVIQEAAFDPTINAQFRRTGSQQASATSRLDDIDGRTTAGPRSGTTTMTVGTTLPKIPVTNGSLSLNTNVSRTTSSTNSLVNPNFGHGVSATLNQPLLEGAGRHLTYAALNRAKLGLNIASINYKSRVLAVISDTENAYYNLVAARETLRIRQLTVQSSQRLFDENSARRTTGVATDLDVLSAEVGVATAKRNIILAEQSVRDAEDRLLNLINVPTFDQRVGPVSFSDYREGAPNFAES